jgi:hypothetical protein
LLGQWHISRQPLNDAQDGIDRRLPKRKTEHDRDFKAQTRPVYCHRRRGWLCHLAHPPSSANGMRGQPFRVSDEAVQRHGSLHDYLAHIPAFLVLRRYTKLPAPNL